MEFVQNVVESVEYGFHQSRYHNNCHIRLFQLNVYLSQDQHCFSCGQSQNSSMMDFEIRILDSINLPKTFQKPAILFFIFSFHTLCKILPAYIELLNTHKHIYPFQKKKLCLYISNFVIVFCLYVILNKFLVLNFIMLKTS